MGFKKKVRGVSLGLNETIFETSSLKSNKRISELPSLRYGPVGAKTTLTGPLRVNDSNYLLENGTPMRPIRKVRFTLPQTDSATTCSNENVMSRRISPTNGKNFKEKATTPATPFSQRPTLQRTPLTARFSLARHFEKFRELRLQNYRKDFGEKVDVPISVSPGVRHRVHPTGRYVRGTLSPTFKQAPQETPASPGGQALLRAARDGDDQTLKELLRSALTVGITETDLNAVDSSGRTILSYVASNGTIELLELLLQIPGLDPNKSDNEGNTPLHFAAQAGQVECLNCLASRCRGVEIDARNNLGFTPLMKAALQGRNKCAKLLLFAGANPTLRDNGRGFRADQWARFCGRYVCADVIEKHARQRLLERSTSYGNWGLEHEMGGRIVMAGKVVPVPPVTSPPPNGIKSKLKKVFRTSSGPSSDTFSSARLVTQLTSAALCASSPVLPGNGSVPPMVKSLLRPLTVPKLQVTLANNNNNNNIKNNNIDGVESCAEVVDQLEGEIMKPSRSKNKKN
ncbi:hypothetical protein ABEB36_001091 [Hypothenemus hampei]|uniref:Uncharacterized protein n=1 Tax=Hypothenemus hampei TaxID=57062 RepID=A0ABD1FDF5_HYPHA